MWFIFALSAAALWGVGQVFAKHGLTHTTPLVNNVLATLFGLLFYIPFTLVHGIQWGLFWSIFPLTLVISAAYFVYYYVIEKGKVALTGTIVATYPFMTVILSTIFLHEQTSVVQKIATMSIILGAILLSLPTDKKLLRKFKFDSWVWWAIAGSLIIGSADFLAKLTINRSDAFTYLFTIALAYVPISIGNIILDSKGRNLPLLHWDKIWPTCVGVGMMALGFIPFNLSFQYGLASLAGPVSSSYIIITAVLAYFFLHERISKLQMLGVTIAAVGTIALGIT